MTFLIVFVDPSHGSTFVCVSYSCLILPNCERIPTLNVQVFPLFSIKYITLIIYFFSKLEIFTVIPRC